MQVTVTTEGDDIYNQEINEEMNLEDFKALLGAESGIEPGKLAIFHNGGELTESKKTLKDYGITHGDVVLMQSRTETPMQRPVTMSDAERLRTHILSNPQLLQQLNNPALEEAARNNPAQFAVLFNEITRQVMSRNQQSSQQPQFNDDPFDVEAQKRIEDAIRQQNIAANMEAALEHSPESFARVTRLYINVEINGVNLVALVDTGAQSTVISPETAERCSLSRLIDARFKGVAKGVGTANIIGRIHSAQIKLDDKVYRQCAMIVVEGKGSELLLGLDMLRTHGASIDLGRNMLTFSDGEVPFLAEYQLPDKQRMIEVHGGVEDEMPMKAAEAAAAEAEAAATMATSLGPATSSSQRVNSEQAPQTKDYPKEHIDQLIALGVSREKAIRCLEQADGNLDLAFDLL